MYCEMEFAEMKFAKWSLGNGICEMKYLKNEICKMKFAANVLKFAKWKIWILEWLEQMC